MAETYDLSDKAKADLGFIWRYTEDRWGVHQADTYYWDIINTISRLAAGERQGRRFDLREGYLKYPVGQHLVYFTRTDGRITVVRILHGSMDVERHL